MDFKESGFMYALGGFIVIFVLAQSLFFLIRAWKQGKKLGLSTAIMRGTVTQSALFSLAPAISIVATILTLSGALGIVLPWIRLTVIGAGIMSITALAVSMLSMLLFMQIEKKKKIAWLQSMAMPLAMFIGMGAVMLLAKVLPTHIAWLEWRG